MKNANKAFAICGIIAPILYLSLAIIGGLLRPGYSHTTHSVSELLVVGAPNKPLMDTILIIYGVLMTLYPIGIHRGINEGKGSKVGSALLVSVMMFMILTRK